MKKNILNYLQLPAIKANNRDTISIILKKFVAVTNKLKFEILLASLLFHLFSGIIFRQLFVYARIMWPFNMLILGLAGVGIFTNKTKTQILLRNILFVIVILVPVYDIYCGTNNDFIIWLNILYAIFFSFLFIETIRFMILPGNKNVDIISAAGCGYLLLIEIATFLFQYFFVKNPASFKGIDTINHSVTFNDFVYFSSITLTSIGFGDITPAVYLYKAAHLAGRNLRTFLFHSINEHRT